MQGNVLFSHIKNCVLKMLCLSSKVKTNMKDRCSIDQKETLKKKFI